MNDDWLKPFPSRDGAPLGGAMERVMLNKAGGPGTIRTVMQLNPDGSTTMLRTRNGMPEFTTTAPVVPAVVDDLTWTYDYNAVKRVGESFVPDTLTFGALTVPRSTAAGGLKNRRAGLVALTSTTYALAVAESGYAVGNTPVVMRGPHYWYKGKDVVTWTTSTYVLTASADYKAIRTVQYGDQNLYLGSMETVTQWTWSIGAACIVVDSASVKRIRVAQLLSSGATAIVVFDYIGSSQVAASSLNFPVVVDGFTITSVDPSKCSWSPDGTQLITVPRSSGFGVNDPVRALIVTVPIDGGGATASLYSFPVTTANNVPYSSSDVSTNFSNPPVEVAGISGLRLFAWYGRAPGDVADSWHDTETPPTTGYRYATGPAGTERVIQNGSTIDAASILNLGFSEGGVPCAVILRHQVSSGKVETRRTEEAMSSAYSSLTFAEINDSWGTLHKVGYAASYDYAYRNLSTINIVTTTAHIYTVYVCTGAGVVFSKEDKVSTTATYADSVLERTVYNDAIAYSATWVKTSTRTSTESDINETSISTSAGTLVYDLACPKADFFDSATVFLATMPPFVHGQVTKIRTRYVDKATSGWPETTTNEETSPVPPPETLEIIYTLMRGGDTLSHSSITRAGAAGMAVFQGTADWRAQDKALLILHADQSITPLGLLYKAGVWRDVVHNPNEPAPESSYPVGIANLSHY